MSQVWVDHLQILSLRLKKEDSYIHISPLGFVDLPYGEIFFRYI